MNLRLNAKIALLTIFTAVGIFIAAGCTSAAQPTLTPTDAPTLTPTPTLVPTEFISFSTAVPNVEINIISTDISLSVRNVYPAVEFPLGNAIAIQFYMVEIFDREISPDEMSNIDMRVAVDGETLEPSKLFWIDYLVGFLSSPDLTPVPTIVTLMFSVNDLASGIHDAEINIINFSGDNLTYAIQFEITTSS